MKEQVRSVGLAVWLPVLLLVLWWYLTREGSSFYFPPLSEIWEAFRSNWLFARLGSDLIPSLVLFVGGYVLAAVVGIVGGVCLGMWRLPREALMPIIDFLRSVPAPAMISVLIILMGFGEPMRLAVITLTAMFPVLLNTVDGVRGVSPEQLELAAAYRVKRVDQLFRIILPAASPQIFAGLRVSLATALAVLIFAEMLAGTRGLGTFIFVAQETYRIPDMWSGIILLGLIGYVVNLIFVLGELRIMRWHRGWRATSKSGS